MQKNSYMHMQLNVIQCRRGIVSLTGKDHNESSHLIYSSHRHPLRNSFDSTWATLLLQVSLRSFRSLSPPLVYIVRYTYNAARCNAESDIRIGATEPFLPFRDSRQAREKIYILWITDSSCSSWLCQLYLKYVTSVGEPMISLRLYDKG